MPESWRSLGVWMLPRARITSRAARCSTAAGPAPTRTPTALSPSKSNEVTGASMVIVRLGRFATGCRNAAAALMRCPRLMFAIA